MAKSTTFHDKRTDAQARAVTPVTPRDFPFAAHADHEAALRERCRRFWAADSGVLVYRGMRVAECFSSGCRNADDSLRWQLGALAASLDDPADTEFPGIVVRHRRCGRCLWGRVRWGTQAPAVRPRFQSAAEALAHPVRPVADTPAGRQTLPRIDYRGG